MLIVPVYEGYANIALNYGQKKFLNIALIFSNFYSDP